MKGISKAFSRYGVYVNVAVSEPVLTDAYHCRTPHLLTTKVGMSKSKRAMCCIVENMH